MISRRGPRAPVPRGYFLCRQKVTKKLLKGSPLRIPNLLFIYAPAKLV